MALFNRDLLSFSLCFCVCDYMCAELAFRFRNASSPESVILHIHQIAFSAVATVFYCGPYFEIVTQASCVSILFSRMWKSHLV